MSVADILEQLAANAGRGQLARGALLANTIAHVAAVPGQILDDRERERIRLRLQAQQDAQAGYARNRETREASDQELQVAAAKQAVQDKADWRQVTGALYRPGGKLDYDAAAAKAQAIGRPDLIETLNEHKTKNATKPIFAKPGDVGIDPQTLQPIPGLTIPDKPPEVGTPAYEVYARQQELLHPTTAPSSPALPGAMATVPPLGAAPSASAPPAATLTPTAAALKAYADQREAAATATHSPIYKEWQDYTKNGGTLGFDAYMTADANRKRPVVNVGGMAGLYNATDPVAIADQIRAGKMPPDISQYGRPVQGAIASVLAKKGANGEAPFDLASAQRTWKAQIRLNATMNGGQQVRLDESIRSGLAMYDKIDTLATQWDGMGIGPLSRANLAAARNGLKGQAAASLANQLTGQIGQLTSDVATIEQGGLTPTNESRAIAEKSLQDWWGKGTILDMTAQGRYNMQIRHLARNTQEPMVPGNGVDTRPAVPATPASTGLIEAKDPQGHIHHAPAGTPLPTGWTLVKP